MKKYIIIVFAIVMIGVSLICFYTNTNYKNIEKSEKFGTYLEQQEEKNFMSLDGIDSADAEVRYDKSLDQYSIEISLTSDEEINDEQIERYKKVLGKTYIDFTIMINGEVR